MTRMSTAMILFLIFSGVLSGVVVINELLYDPLGTDTGNEWVELHNKGATDINLEGARLQIAGSTFSTVYTFTHYILRAGRYVLIGEHNITQAIFTTPLVMQNGGAETDAVRFISADGSYTDTVLYDNPNSNALTDDTGVTASAFAEDVPAGYSLARIADGVDTGNCATDFIAEALPTPGLPNRFPIDYGLSDTELLINNGTHHLNTRIVNFSLADCDTLSITMQITLNTQLLHSYDIQPIPSGESTLFSTPLSTDANSNGLLKVELLVADDNNPSDNTWTMLLGNNTISSMAINEILYNPDTGNQEWIELHIPPMAGCEGSFTIIDAANNSATVSLPSLCPEYLVLCRNQALLLTRYPDCPPSNVLQVSNLPALNNEGDTLILTDANGIVLDSISYVGVSSRKDISLERFVTADSTVSWHYSYALPGGTPGQANSEPPPPSELEPGKIKLVGSPFNPMAMENMRLMYNFTDASNTLNCYLYNLSGRKVHTIAADHRVGSSGELVWDGRDGRGNPFSRGIYILLVEAKNSNKQYFMRKQLTVVLATR